MIQESGANLLRCYLHQYLVLAEKLRSVSNVFRIVAQALIPSVELLCALEYPNFSADELRTACDALSVFFVLHEYTDLEDGSTVRSIVNITLDAIRNPYKPRPDGELFVGEMSRQYVRF